MYLIMDAQANGTEVFFLMTSDDLAKFLVAGNPKVNPELFYPKTVKNYSMS